MSLTPDVVLLKRERIGFLIIAALMIAPILLFALFLRWTMATPLTLEAEQRVKIARGDGFMEIGEVLASAGIVRSASLFRLYALSRGWAGRLQPGEYLFSGVVSIPEAAGRLLEGPGDIRVTFPEGWTVQEMEDRLVGMELILPGELTALALSPNLFHEQFPFLREMNVASLEGFLFPNTYLFNPRLGPRSLVENMLTAFENKILNELEAKFYESPQSIPDIVIMASMLERESARSEERALIADILWRRLEIGMPLQVDATVIYAWRRVNPRWTLEGRDRLLFAHLEIDSPFNTYRFRGMPPGAIGNPGIDAIRSAVAPTQNEYWFYLAHEGITYFSRTFEEHVALKNKLYR